MASNRLPCEWCEEPVAPDHDSYDCGATMRDKWKKAESDLSASRRQVEALREALHAVIGYHEDMVHGPDCRIRLCESGDCEHADEADCEAHEDECECCLGVAFVARRALSSTPQPASPHDRPDCPCGHPLGTIGPCAGCNCADEDTAPVDLGSVRDKAPEDP